MQDERGAASGRADAARARIKRAQGLLREAVADLAQLADEQSTLGVSTVRDAEGARRVQDLITMGVAHYGGVDVIIIGRPSRRHSPRPPMGAKEKE